MKLLGFAPQNRKKKPKAAKRGFTLPAIDWGALARRTSIIAVVVVGLTSLAWAFDRPIRAISIDGSFQRVSPGQVEQAAAPFLKAGFMSADLDAVQRAVEALPWVEHARVQRRWPNSVHLLVVEQVAAARWGESGLLNARGDLFVRSSAHVPPELPRLSGPEGSEREVAERYLQAQGRMLEVGLRVAAIRLDDRGAWEMDLDNGLTIRLGRRDVDQRLDRFIHTASQLVARRAGDISYVDMRYSNGFTIGWRNSGMPAVSPAKPAEDTDA
jgi:cell division protein FtsQ